MTMADAGFEKDHGKPRWSLAWITNTLADPWSLPGYAEKMYEAAESNDPLSLWLLSARLMELPDAMILPETQRGAVAETNWLAATDYFLEQVQHAHHVLEQAFAGVGKDDRIYLAASILAPTFESEDNESSRIALINAGIPESEQKKIEAEGRLLDSTDVSLAWLALVEKIDLAALHGASVLFYQAVAGLREAASGIRDWPDEIVVRESPHGHVVIGTTGDDVYEAPALVILDPGGHDVYRDGAGAANGLSGHFLSAVIDLAGDDLYRSHELIGAGAALWGISLLMDEQGDDTYDAHYAGAGAAVFGAAWCEDVAGRDMYRGHAIGQGAAMIGFGFLIDHTGDDVYDVGFYGQGFSGVKGWGLLLDREGNDRYVAGNRRQDHERNDERHLSMSQGFSIGMRPHAGGGVAALIDLAGNDTYTGDIYAQGVSYYYSAGFLLDGGGHDRYSMYQYGQGCGIHLSLGLLADAWGNDFYTGYILAQGAAHDYAVGMLFDHKGDDTYTADHHTQGRALNNAFALLVDRNGSDAYFGRQRDGAQGIGNNGGFRDYGSLALLLDLGGADLYSGGFSNRTITLRPLYGVIYDYEEDAGHE